MNADDLTSGSSGPSDGQRGRGRGARSGRAARQAARAAATIAREPFLIRKIRPYELVSEEGLELLEHNADTILEEVGVEIRDYPSAIDRFVAAGAIADGTRVRFPRGM